MTIEWSLPAAHDALADAVPDHDMLVWNDVRRSFAEVRDRSRGLAGFLVERSDRPRSRARRARAVGVRADATSPSSCTTDPSTSKSMLGAYRARAVPFNVNQHYAAAEIGALLRHGRRRRRRSTSGRSGALVGEAIGAIGDALVLVDIDDGSGIEPLAGSIEYEAAIAAGDGVELPVPSGDDLYLVCTGGTTGRPKGVLWRQADIFVAGHGRQRADHGRVAGRGRDGRPRRAGSRCRR